MKLIPQSGYYVWYCDWCDSRNLTLWPQFEKGNVACYLCHTLCAHLPATVEERISTIQI
jgi:hypothetical protein